MLGMTVGLPLSGKSTWIDDTLHDWQIVCPDDIRLAFGHEFYAPIEPVVWAITETMVRSHLIHGNRVLVDATNITVKERAKWKRIGEEYAVPVVAFVGFSKLTECIDRAARDDRYNMIPVIRRMMTRFEPVHFLEEGIEVVGALDMTHEEKLKYAMERW